jgi:hypothetical protein
MWGRVALGGPAAPFIAARLLPRSTDESQGLVASVSTGLGAGFGWWCGRGGVLEGLRSAPVGSVGQSSRPSAQVVAGICVGVAGRRGGRRRRGALGCVWARADDVAKRRRQELVVCRATCVLLVSDLNLCALQCHARARFPCRGCGLLVLDHSLVGGLGLLGELELGGPHQIVG